MSRPRLKHCTEQWPECTDGEYNPSCCRFPKSCSCTIYNDDTPPDELEDAEVIEFPKPESSENLQCIHCGCEWWRSPGITVDANTGHVTGYVQPLTCTECGEETK